MAKYKSPGQKRKTIVRVLSLLIFLGATYVGSGIFGKVRTESLAWVENHQEVSAEIFDLSFEEEEYRNFKGRKRYRNVYTVDYRFTVDQEVYENQITVSESEYSTYEIGSDVKVWYYVDDPYINDTKSNMESDVASNDTVGNAFEVVPYTGPACLFLYWLLSLIFVRESKNALPEGFFTENSWLDIDDNYLVFVDGEDLVFFDIDSKKSSQVQSAYQSKASLEELIAISGTSKLNRVPLSEVTELTSDHNSDVFVIDHGEESYSVEFLNQAVKTHALDVIKQFIPSTLNYEKIERTRLQAAIPSLIFMLILALTGYFLDIFLLNVVLGFVGVFFVLPRIFSRLVDPTVTEKWFIPEEVSVE